MLTPREVAHYREEGYLLLRSRISEPDLLRFERALERHPPLDGNTPGTWPEAGRYTLAKNCLADPELAFIAEHPGIVAPVRQVLDDPPRLTAFVVYDRTPGGAGLRAHNDYKRWRPVGSSMNWLFSIIPLCDFDEKRGPLYIAPRSHRLDRIRDRGERVLSIAPAIRPDSDAFVDPKLARGDLLLMNMHLWHRAAPNRSGESRLGIFNKYAGAHAPPATGYLLYSECVYEALSDAGRPLIAVHSDRPIAATRLLLQRSGSRGPEFLLTRDRDWSLPGGATWDERAIPDWDAGNYIAALQGHIDEQLKIRTPWVSWVGDYEEGDHLCRVYAYDLPDHAQPIADGQIRAWMTVDELEARGDELAFGYEPLAASEWLRTDLVRGKGLAQAQCRVDQYAY